MSELSLIESFIKFVSRLIFPRLLVGDSLLRGWLLGPARLHIKSAEMKTLNRWQQGYQTAGLFGRVQVIS